MLAVSPVVRLTPVVEVSGSVGPLFRVKLPLNRHQVVTHTKRPTRETTLPAWVPIRQSDAGKHIPPAGKKKQHIVILPFFSHVGAVVETHRNIPITLSLPVLLTKAPTPGVNPIGQSCPSETGTLAWQTVPPGGLGINIFQPGSVPPGEREC